GYRAGSRIKATKRLTSISTWHRETKIGDYRLTYQQRDKRTALLTAIEQCDSGGTCFPATSMAWENENDRGFGGEIGSGVIDRGYDNNRWWVDVTGDGRSDFCRLVGSHGSYRVSCKISTGSGFGAEVSTGVIDPGYAHNRGWADVNGDGRGDFCRLVGGSGKYRVTCKTSVGNSFGAEVSTGVIGPSEDKNPWWWVDFNGDGRSDFCRFVYGIDNLTYQMSCKISTGTGFGREIRSGYLNSGWDDNNRWWADIDGDGKSDFCRMVWVSPGKYQMDCKVSLGNSFGREIGTGVIDVGYESNRWWTDINGDGLSDFCRLVGSRNQVSCKVSIGTGFGQEIRTGVIDVGYEGHRWWADANGDGLSDYCRLVGGAGNYRVHCKSSTGNGFGAEISTGVIDPGYDHSRWWADINGDGAADYVRLVGGTGKYRVTAKSTTQKPTQVSSITTGLGEQTRITYKPLNDGSVHSIGKGAAYPERDIQGPLHVVSQTKRDNGLGGDITTRYNYGGAKVDIHGRGFLGFEWMKATDTQSGITTTTTYRQDFPYTGKVAATEQRQANGKL
ncbi:MAG: toxin TcdB middle/N-terminal domain-containing protein, partial [Sedimenticola sp.]